MRRRFDVARRSHDGLAHATKALTHRRLPAFHHAFGTQPVADRLERLAHASPLHLGGAPQLSFCRAHCTSSFTDRIVCSGTRFVFLARLRASEKRTAAATA